LRGVAILLAVPLALSVAGGLLGTHVSPDTENTGMILRQVRVCGIHPAILPLTERLGRGWHLRSHLRPSMLAAFRLPIT